MIPVNFNDRITTKKGNLGEELIDSFLLKKNCVFYRPAVNGSHLFDRFCYKIENGKQLTFIVEIKTKPRRSAYPDTGIEIKHYDKYKNFSKQHNFQVWLFFVDEALKSVYGNELKILEQKIEVKDGNYNLSYPLISGKQIYFPMVKMKHYFKLTDEQCREIKNKSSRNKKYDDIYNKEIDIPVEQTIIKPTLKPEKTKKKKTLEDDLFFQRKYFQEDLFKVA